MAPTACSICAAPSVPEGSDMCPRCRRNFVDERVVGTSVTATRAGGLTGAVTARPGPVVAALLLTAAAWFLRYLDLIAPVGDPVWLLALPAVAVASAGCVMAAVGPAKHLPVVVGLLGALAALLWPTGRPLVDGAYGAAGLGLVVATVSEPSGFSSPLKKRPQPSCPRMTGWIAQDLPRPWAQ
ncbi:MAG: hypothetical protein INH41_03075 [Myxococcaceae bacterium]|nr:hypothetical protein [Myxococcaceae bacterium]